MSAPKTVLTVIASAQGDAASSTSLARDLAARFGPVKLIERDLNKTPLPFLSEELIGAFFTPADQRTAAQEDLLTLSDDLIAELRAADVVVIASPIYNFSVPARLKAWIDLIARAGVTFRYTENGPVGLLDGKTGYLVLTSGGTRVDSDIDYAGRYLRHILGFIGITDVTHFAADGQMVDGPASVERARQQINAVDPQQQAA